MLIDDDAQESPLKSMTLVITAQPQPVAGVIGGNAVFTAAFITNAPAATTYAWQIQTDGVIWGDLIETPGYYEGVATTALTVKAIDNFLATRTSCNFRCVARYRGAPTFTLGAALTVPIHAEGVQVNSYRMPGGVGGNTPGGTLVINAQPIAATGLTGSVTYSWAFVSGDTLTCLSPNSAAPQFILFGYPGGTLVSRWRCTATNGSTSVTTDVIEMVGVQLTAPANGFPLSQGADYSLNGAQVTAAFNPFGAFVAPWAAATTRFLRTAATPVISLSTPNLVATEFTISTPVDPGTAAILDIYSLYHILPPNPFAGYEAYYAGTSFE